MDPFVIASLGKKTYRTRVIRHNLNPIFEERMIFQVLQHEQNYSLNFSVVDRDKLSGNDFVGTASIPLPDITSTATDADPDTGLYHLKEPDGDSHLQPVTKSRFRLPLSRSASSSSLSKVGRPALKSRNSSSSLLNLGHPDHPHSHSLAPTSAPSNINHSPPLGSPESAKFNHSPPHVNGNGDGGHVDPNSPDNEQGLRLYTVPLHLKNKDRWEDKFSPELFIRAKYVPYNALRQQFWRSILRQYDADESGMISKVELSTMLDTLGSTLKESTINGFFSRFSHLPDSDPTTSELTFDEAVICLEDALIEASHRQTIGTRLKAHIPDRILHAADGGDSEADSGATTPMNQQSSTAVPVIIPDPLGIPGEEGDHLDKDDLHEKGEEHVVEIRECPICHQPRLNKRSDADIITHIATCASQDWRQVNNIVMAGFVTSSQAQRKWYSKVITKISYGGYKLGANSANILVQDRITGQINEERMSVYVRLGIRLLYKGLKSREMEKKRSELRILFRSHN
jgi:phosphatidylserine decarboxylase